jgi:hypothetical protein
MVDEEEKSLTIVGETDDESFDILEDENGEEILAEKPNNSSRKTLTEMLYECFTIEEPYRFYLIHPENNNFIIIITNGSAYIINELKDYFISLTEGQVVFKEFKIKERNFWDFECSGYIMKEFTEEQIIKNKEKW